MKDEVVPDVTVDVADLTQSDGSVQWSSKRVKKEAPPTVEVDTE